MNTFSQLAQATMPLSTLTAAAREAAQISPSVIVGVIVLVLVGVVVLVALITLIVVAQWKIYKKAGYPGWAAIVPFYNSVIQLRMTNLPLWWVVLLFVPIVNIVFFVLLTRRLAGVFSKGPWFTVGLIFLPFIFYPILGFGRALYHNGYPPARPMSEEVKWALIAALTFVLIESLMMGGGDSKHHALTFIADSTYVTDGEYVYYNDTIVPLADPDSFVPNGYYANDMHHVYFEGQLLADVSPRDFTVSPDGMYGYTSSAVYYFGDLIAGVDVGSFQPLGIGYAKDAKHVYIHGEPVKNADVESFSAAPEGYGITKAGDYYDAQDVHHYYYYGEVVKPGSNQAVGE